MSAGVAIKVDGAPKLRRTLKRAGDNLADLKEVHAAVAAYVAQLAANRAPRRSGRLAASVRGNRAAARSVVSAGGASLPYAKPIHWGWPARNISPNPWISETAQDTETEWLAIFQAGIEKEIAKIEGA